MGLLTVGWGTVGDSGMWGWGAKMGGREIIKESKGLEREWGIKVRSR